MLLRPESSRAPAAGTIAGSSLSSARHTELGELCGNSLAVTGGSDMLVYVRNPTVGANVERPTGRKRLIRVDHPVGARDRLRRIAEERIVDAE